MEGFQGFSGFGVWYGLDCHRDFSERLGRVRRPASKMARVAPNLPWVFRVFQGVLGFLGFFREFQGCLEGFLGGDLFVLIAAKLRTLCGETMRVEP